MKSLRSKILALLLPSSVLSLFLVGALGVLWTNSVISTDSAQILDLMVLVQSDGLNSIFADVEHSASVIAQYVGDDLESISALKDPHARRPYFKKLEDISYYIGNCTSNLLSVYIRYAHDYSDEDAGILWRKIDGVFERGKIPQFSTNESGPGQLWFYQLHKTGKAQWISPYYNSDFNEYVVSYVYPVYKDGVFFALVGMDVDFDDIASIVNSISVYDTGYAFLTDPNFVVMYHRSIPAGTNILERASHFKLLETSGDSANLYEYEFKNSRYRMIFKPLLNSMNLVVSVPAKEIDQQRMHLSYSILLAILVIVSINFLLGVIISKRLTKPLDELNKATRNIVAGDYDLKFPNRPSGELGDLMGTFMLMARSLKVQFEYINSLVYMDSMTGSKNKRAFIDRRNEINEQIKKYAGSDIQPIFGVVVFDVNDLKYMNDTFGHKAGDALIKNACNMISDVFSESTVYRIGGDEFVTVITGRDYEKRAELMQTMKEKMLFSEMNATEPYDKLSIAAGLAEFDVTVDHEFQSVFERADEAMYKTKVAMKGSAR